MVIVPDSAKVPEDSDDSNGATIVRPALVARMIELYAHAAFALAMGDPTDPKIEDDNVKKRNEFLTDWAAKRAGDLRKINANKPPEEPKKTEEEILAQAQVDARNEFDKWLRGKAGDRAKVYIEPARTLAVALSSKTRIKLPTPLPWGDPLPTSADLEGKDLLDGIAARPDRLRRLFTAREREAAAVRERVPGRRPPPRRPPPLRRPPQRRPRQHHLMAARVPRHCPGPYDRAVISAYD